ncbi:hypothetical protein NLI96_g5357 [Meripilus lineatus]|uniref:lytic cellulose monooxygenase (C4-dehydrogenating) n=1 Tax=Meripilus lineatus TaxID=2056292 RepID=A0AAD5V3N0_9APHY|nr:hypothetical protein NLI96_g5357 [Physisporinus lineatus]
MKFSTLIYTALVAQGINAHYTIPDLISNGSTSAVTSVTDPEFRCYELDLQNTAGATGTATVSAGSTIGFKGVDIHFDSRLRNDAFYHPGVKYFSVYMAKASPAANSPAAGTGQTWFKVWEDAPVYKNGALVFPSQTMDSFTFTVPKSLPNGQYLIRAEQIALHSASTFGGAQFYISCAQVNIVNGGNGNPSPLVSIPGVYTGREPGILINIYSLPANYPGYQSRKTIMFFVLPVIYLFVLYQLVLQFGEDEKVVCCSDHGDLALLHYMSYDVSYLAFSN